MIDANRENAVDAPPFLGRWSLVYAAVLIYLTLLLALLYLLTGFFRY